VIELTHQQSGHGLVTDAQHFGSGAGRSYMLITPANFVVEAKAGNCRAIGVELDPFGPRQVVAQILRERQLMATHSTRALASARVLIVWVMTDPFLALGQVPITTVALTFGAPQANGSMACEFPPAVGVAIQITRTTKP
jgi:hypothetical protein